MPNDFGFVGTKVKVESKIGTVPLDELEAYVEEPMRASAVRDVAIEHPGKLEPILKNIGFHADYLDTAEGQTLKNPLEEY